MRAPSKCKSNNGDRIFVGKNIKKAHNHFFESLHARSHKHAEAHATISCKSNQSDRSIKRKMGNHCAFIGFFLWEKNQNVNGLDSCVANQCAARENRDTRQMYPVIMRWSEENIVFDSMNRQITKDRYIDYSAAHTLAHRVYVCACSCFPIIAHNWWLFITSLYFRRMTVERVRTLHVDSIPLGLWVRVMLLILIASPIRSLCVSHLLLPICHWKKCEYFFFHFDVRATEMFPQPFQTGCAR